MREDVFLFRPINFHNMTAYKSFFNVYFDERQKSNHSSLKTNRLV